MNDYDAAKWLGMLLLKSSALLIAAMIAHRLLKNRSAAFKCQLWSAALVGLLILPAAAWVVPKWSFPDFAKALSQSSNRQNEWIAQVLDFPETAHPKTPTQDASVASSNTSFEPGTADGNVSVGANLREFGFQWLPALLTSVWLTGAALILLATLTSLSRAHRLVRDSSHIDDQQWLRLLNQARSELSSRDRVRLFETKERSVPVACGLFKPAILLPSNASAWSKETKLDVLRHELAHIQRGDCRLQLLARLACALYWINPLIWPALRSMRLDQEKACDDLAMSTGSHPGDYAEQLIRIARESRPRSAMCPGFAMARTSQLEQRLKAILNRGQDRAVAGIKAKAILFMLALSLAFSMASYGAQTEPDQSTAEVKAESNNRAFRASNQSSAGYHRTGDDTSHLSESEEETLRHYYWSTQETPEPFRLLKQLHEIRFPNLYFKRETLGQAEKPLSWMTLCTKTKKGIKRS